MYSQFSANAVVVQKYGGTSVGTPDRIQHVARRIARQIKAGHHHLAIVVSAMAGETNRLVKLVAEVNPAASARSYDMTVAAGEQVSVGLLCAALEAHGVEAVPFTGLQLGVRTDSSHSRARIQSIDTEKIRAVWNRNAIPVVAGFQGITEEYTVTTLGRGGSDTSAVALAAALDAVFCEINTDVSGVFTADPRTVPTARLIDRIDYASCLELAVLGGKVLHPRCVEVAAKFQIPLVVRSTFDDDDARRTIVNHFNEKEVLESPVVSAVSVEKQIAKFSLHTEGPIEISDLFKTLSAADVNIDIIIYDTQDNSGGNVGFSVADSDREKTEKTLQGWIAGRPIRVETRPSLAKVSVIGLGMQTHSGVAARIFDALKGNGIELIMVTTSEIKVSCVVPGAQSEKAAQVLHQAFLSLA